MKRIAEFWDDAVVPAFANYIRIPAKSPHFDKAWQTNGHLEEAVTLAAQWCLKHAVPGMKLEVVRLEGKTPVLFIEIEGQSKETVLIYGHLDKQPEMTGWREGLGPWQPKIVEGPISPKGWCLEWEKPSKKS